MKIPLAQVIAGEHDTESDKEELQVIEIDFVIPHERYDGKVKAGYDIALVRVKRKFHFGRRNVGYIGMNLDMRDTDALLEREGKCIAIGWGKTGHHSKGSNVLRKIEMRAMRPRYYTILQSAILYYNRSLLGHRVIFMIWKMKCISFFISS